MQLSNVLSTEGLFYACIIPFILFFGSFAFIMYPLRDVIHPTGAPPPPHNRSVLCTLDLRLILPRTAALTTLIIYMFAWMTDDVNQRDVLCHLQSTLGDLNMKGGGGLRALTYGLHHMTWLAAISSQEADALAC